MADYDLDPSLYSMDLDQLKIIILCIILIYE